MKSASSRDLKLDTAKEKDIKDIIELLYITEPYPEDEWGCGTEEEMKATLNHLLRIKENRFSLDNILVARKDNQLVGILLFLEGKDIDMLTSKSESAVIAMQKSIINKIKFMWYILENWFLEECLEDEFYIANLAIKPEFRKHGYSKIMIKEANKIAKQKGYKKLSLLANNDKLVKFYETVGFQVENEKTRRMVAYI